MTEGSGAGSVARTNGSRAERPKNIRIRIPNTCLLNSFFETWMYDTGKALQQLVKNPVPSGLDKQWTEDENRRFIKGLRLHGKNFFKIRSEFLPEKETGDLITYYYLWKKTPAASGSRPRGRRHRPSVLRRVKSTKEGGSVGGGGKKKGTSSASEVEDSGGEDSGEHRNPFHCRHCAATVSKDWHHGGKDMKLLCTGCRLHYKR